MLRLALALSAVTVISLAHASAPEDAAAGVMRRVFPQVAGHFHFREMSVDDGQSAYEVHAKDGEVTVAGSDGVSMCRGAYDYLRDVVGAQATWSGTTLGGTKLKDKDLKQQSPYFYVLQDNVCTFGYTTAFYGWKEWERYLDVMALHGVNMEFAPVGGEAIWERVWKNFGLTQANLDNFFTGPAFLPWHRMGNVNKHDGPLPESYQTQSVALQKKILARMRSLDMKPVAPAFAGFVPPGFKERYPNENVLHVASWADFGEDYRTWILHPLSPMYQQIGGAYIKEWQKEFGPAEFYLADSFNELEVPVPPERAKRLEELALFGKAVYDGIRAGNPNGTWVMQGWLFSNDKAFWDADSVKALLSRVPDDKMIILDLYAEAEPIWKVQNAFYGKKWIVSNITTWGGNNQVYGNFPAYANLSASTLSAPNHGNLVGYGMSFEGSESNEAEYELMTDSAWTPNPIDIPEFLRATCVRSRYGADSAEAVKAWDLFAKSVYAMSPGMHPNHLTQFRPRELGPSSRGYSDDSENFRKGVEHLVAARDVLKDNALYRADVAEFLGQWMLLEADKRLRDAVVAQQEGMAPESKESELEFEKLAGWADTVLDFHPLDRLERWVQLARAWGRTPAEKNYYEADAKRQVTTWGGPVLSEYAAKMWSGLISGYYVPRWKAWLDAKREGRDFDVKAWEEKWITTPGGFQVQREKDLITAAPKYVSLLRSFRPSTLSEKLLGLEVGAWKTGDQSEEYSYRNWDITRAVTGDGILTVRFQYTTGAHRLDISGVQLLADGVKIAEDTHEGRTGLRDVDNAFRFAVTGFSAGRKYEIRAKVRSDGGNDSNGVIYAKLKS